MLVLRLRLDAERNWKWHGLNLQQGERVRCSFFLYKFPHCLINFDFFTLLCVALLPLPFAIFFIFNFSLWCSARKGSSIVCDKAAWLLWRVRSDINVHRCSYRVDGCDAESEIGGEVKGSEEAKNNIHSNSKHNRMAQGADWDANTKKRAHAKSFEASQSACCCCW